MSARVRPSPAKCSEYKLSHLRRLDVTPGITGLWQVQGRQDPSFDSYISLDVTYIENWSIWLDIKIIVRTVGVVFAGTGILNRLRLAHRPEALRPTSRHGLFRAAD